MEKAFPCFFKDKVSPQCSYYVRNLDWATQKRATNLGQNFPERLTNYQGHLIAWFTVNDFIFFPKALAARIENYMNA